MIERYLLEKSFIGGIESHLSHCHALLIQDGMNQKVGYLRLLILYELCWRGEDQYVSPFHFHFKDGEYLTSGTASQCL